MSILDAFPHTATAKRRTRTKGTLGGTKDSFPTILFTDRPCWQQPAGDSEIDRYAKRQITITDKVYFTIEPEVDERDILIIGGRTFEVRSRAVPDASAGLGVVYRVMVELWDKGRL